MGTVPGSRVCSHEALLSSRWPARAARVLGRSGVSGVTGGAHDPQAGGGPELPREGGGLSPSCPREPFRARAQDMSHVALGHLTIGLGDMERVSWGTGAVLSPAQAGEGLQCFENHSRLQTGGRSVLRGQSCFVSLCA